MHDGREKRQRELRRGGIALGRQDCGVNTGCCHKPRHGGKGWLGTGFHLNAPRAGDLNHGGANRRHFFRIRLTQGTLGKTALPAPDDLEVGIDDASDAAADTERAEGAAALFEEGGIPRTAGLAVLRPEEQRVVAPGESLGTKAGDEGTSLGEDGIERRDFGLDPAQVVTARGNGEVEVLALVAGQPVGNAQIDRVVLRPPDDGEDIVGMERDVGEGTASWASCLEGCSSAASS